MPVTVRIDTSGFDRKNQTIHAVFTSQRTMDDLIGFFRDYHLRFRMKWRGSKYMLGPRSNMFWQEVVAGWEDPHTSGGIIFLHNKFGLLSWKVTGGTIIPKIARMLTIPLIPDAKGISAREFAAEEGTPLFRIGNALMRRIGKQLEAVYALKSSVQQDPWPGALPTNDQIAEVYKQSVTEQIHEIL